MSNLLSIIVPVYNTPIKLFSKCVESLIGQTYSNIEIILVDDGSTSGVEKLCDIYAKDYNAIKVIHKTNGGLAAARNSGQEKASGDWIMFVDSDDWIEKDTCSELMFECNAQENIDVIAWGYVHQFDDKIENCIFKYKNGKLFRKNDRKKLILDALEFPSLYDSSCWKLFNLNFLKRNHLFHDEKIRQGSEDLEFMLRVLSSINALVTINKYFYHYVMNSASITNSFNENNAYRVQTCFEKMEEYLLTMQDAEIKNAFYKRAWYAICASIISGFMNPNNGLSYAQKKVLLRKYLSTPFIQRVIGNMNIKRLSITRRMVYEFLKRDIYLPVHWMALIRGKQKRR